MFRKDVEDGFTRLDLPKIATRFVGTKWSSHPRLEKAIKESNSTPTDIDPMTNFVTVYKKAADKHYDDLLEKYAGDLETSQIFVSRFTPLARPVSPQCILLH